MSDNPADWGAKPVEDDGPLSWGAKPVEAPSEQQPTSWSDVPLAAVKNAPASAAKFATDLVQPIIHPIDTATGLKNLALGVAEKTGLKSGSENVPYADAAGQFLADRYGGMDQLKHTLAHDPVGFAADLSTVLTGGAGLAARTPLIGARAAEMAGTAARLTDPLSAVGKAVQGTGKLASEVIGGVGTHTGGESLRLAAKAGYEGGDAARAFQENLRGSAGAADAVADARDAVGAMRKERGEVYRNEMKGITNDPTILDFSKIDQALSDVSKVKTYKGQVISASTADIRQRIAQTIDEWKALDPAEFHTVEGIDALKQKIGDLRSETQYGTPANVVANRAYRAIRQTIVDQAPEYAKVMKGYEEASSQIKEMERTLSLNPNASIDTALRKLQSVLRNNVNTNYGRRAELADVLVNAGAPHLMQKLAGQALSSWTPRGIGKLSASLGAEILAMSLGTGLASAGTGGLAAAATLPFLSPRLVGELSYYTGKGARAVPIHGGASAAYQTGRTENELTRRLP